MAASPQSTNSEALAGAQSAYTYCSTRFRTSSTATGENYG